MGVHQSQGAGQEHAGTRVDLHVMWRSGVKNVTSNQGVGSKQMATATFPQPVDKVWGRATENDIYKGSKTVNR